MVISDGALTPAISVMSAVQGIKSKKLDMSQGIVVSVSVVIMLLLFLFQRFGTSKVSFLFSPIMIIWFMTNTMIGLYNIVQYYPGPFKAFILYYIISYFHKHHKQGWVMLGGIVLCITGAEAMFADLGHFNKKSIQLAFSVLICLSRIRDEPIMNPDGQRGSKILVNLMRIWQWMVICCSLRCWEMKMKRLLFKSY